MQQDHINHAASLTSDALRHGSLKAFDAPDFLREMYAALSSLGQPVAPGTTNVAELLVPAVPIKKSVADDHLVSLIDGTKLQMLR